MPRNKLSSIRRISPQSLTTGFANFFPMELDNLLAVIKAAGKHGATSRVVRDTCRAMRRAQDENNFLPEELKQADVTCTKIGNGFRYFISQGN